MSSAVPNGTTAWRLDRLERSVEKLDDDVNKKIDAVNEKIDRLILWLVGSVLTMALTVGIFTLTLLTGNAP